MPGRYRRYAGGMTLYPRDRLAKAATAAEKAGLDALLVTPGADLRYLTGYDALPLERLTCLVVPTRGDAFLVVPGLERPRAVESPAGNLGIDIVGWAETEDPYGLAARRLTDALGGQPETIGISDRTWVLHGLRFRDALAGTRHELAGRALRELRMRKTAEELAALRAAAEIIDAVHEQIQTWSLVGRTEAEVGRDIADAIIQGGNTAVNFVIVGSGPNGASPHHDLGPRVIEPGDAVVFDIGGTTPDGYCSDITRTYVAGGEPDPEFARLYGVLQDAQERACAAIKPGITAEDLDAVARDVIADAGYGEQFIHRTGHGIGLEEHEEPYIVSGNAEPLEAGMAFSVEPGIYLPGRFGARIEDICVCTESGGERLNHVSRDLLVVDAR